MRNTCGRKLRKGKRAWLVGDFQDRSIVVYCMECNAKHNPPPDSIRTSGKLVKDTTCGALDGRQRGK